MNKGGTIVCLGDSLTYGYGTYRDCAWPAETERILGIPCINRGVNGDCTFDMLYRFDEDVLPCRPETLVLLAGANDLANGFSADSALGTVRKIIARAEENGIRVLLMCPTDIEEGSFLRFRCAEELEDLRRRMAEYRTGLKGLGLPCLDLSEEYPKEMKAAGEAVLYQDGTHPTEAGYLAIGRIFARWYLSLKEV